MISIIDILQIKYGKVTLTKKELAGELNLSTQTIDRRIQDGMGIPNYIRSGGGTKATYLFPITEIALYLEGTIKVM